MKSQEIKYRYLLKILTVITILISSLNTLAGEDVGGVNDMNNTKDRSNIKIVPSRENVSSGYEFNRADYHYPIIDPYKATIIGTSTMMTNGVSDTVPSKKYKISLSDRKVPESLWYLDKLRFSLSKQNKKAPLIFVLAGTGGSYKDWKSKAFERILHDAGYHVILISSTFNSNYIVNAPGDEMPGILKNDAKVLYNVMQKAYEKVKDKIEVTDFYMTGYSLGATHSAYISYLDETEKYFDFKRVFMVNPAVNLYESAKILDDLLDDNIQDGRDGTGRFLEQILERVARKYKGSIKISPEDIYQVFKDNILSQEEMGALIGIAFRFISIDVNYLTDMLNDRKVYVKEEPKKFDSMKEIWKKINGATFIDYAEKIAFSYYNEKDKTVTLDKFLKQADLSELKNYLQTTDKIAMVTNRDEIILNDRHLKFLKDTFKDRGIIYPLGGHCGNMYYEYNVKVMLNYLSEGVLKNEM